MAYAVAVRASHLDFRLLWGGETAAKFDAPATGVAMPPVAVSTLHASTSKSAC